MTPGQGMNDPGARTKGCGHKATPVPSGSGRVGDSGFLVFYSRSTAVTQV